MRLQTSRPATPFDVQSAEVSLHDGSVEPDFTAALLGTAPDETGTVDTVRAATWTSANPFVASVGLMTAALVTIAPGTTVISAAIGGREAQASFQVVPFSVRRVNVTAATSQVEVCQTVTAVAIAFDRKDRTLADRGPTWTLRAPAVASVSEAGGDSDPFTVDTLPVVSVVIGFQTNPIPVAQKTQAVATAYDIHRNILPGPYAVA